MTTALGFVISGIAALVIAGLIRHIRNRRVARLTPDELVRIEQIINGARGSRPDIVRNPPHPQRTPAALVLL